MTREQFLQGFAPDKFYIMALDETRVHIGKGPNLLQVWQELGIEPITELIGTYVQNLCDFTGARNSLTSAQIADLACTILCEFKYLKVAELGLFFHKFKAGHFGKIYKELYTMDITTNLKEWRSYCLARQNELLWETTQHNFD